jgi:hypothetical protein
MTLAALQAHGTRVCADGDASAGAVGSLNGIGATGAWNESGVAAQPLSPLPTILETRVDSGLAQLIVALDAPPVYCAIVGAKVWVAIAKRVAGVADPGALERRFRCGKRPC